MTNVFTFVFCIVTVVLLSGLLKTWIENRKRNDETIGPEIDEMLGTIESLEERIRVLERIVTAHNYDLKKEIDSL